VTTLLFVLLAAAAAFWMGRRQGAADTDRQRAALQSEVEAREARDRATQAASLSESQSALTRAQAACRAELDALNLRLTEARRQAESAAAALRDEQARALSERQSMQQRIEVLTAQGVDLDAKVARAHETESAALAREASLVSQLEDAQALCLAEERLHVATRQARDGEREAAAVLAREAYQALKSLQAELAAERAAHAQTRETGGALAREAYAALRRAA